MLTATDVRTSKTAKINKSYHSLYGSTSCCISHTPPLSMGEGDFRPPTLRPLKRFLWNLKYITINYFPDTTPHAKISGAYSRRGWSGQTASLTHKSLIFFLPSSRSTWAYLEGARGPRPQSKKFFLSYSFIVNLQDILYILTIKAHPSSLPNFWGVAIPLSL